MYNSPPVQGSSHYTPEDCLRKLRALADETRWKIVTTLASDTEKPLSATDLIEQLGITSYNVSKHARILREANLISVNRKGKFVFYRLEPKAFRGGDLDLGACSLRFAK